MKAPLIILSILAVIAIVIYSRKRVNTIMVSSGEFDIENHPASIAYNDTEYKYNNSYGSFNVDGKTLPLAFVFKSGSFIDKLGKDVLGFPKKDYRPGCTTDVKFENDTYKFLKEDTGWCLYEK